MKTLKSIQKNQEQLNSLLMEKWGYENEALEEQGPVTGRGQERGTDKPPPKGKQGPVTGQGTNLPPPKEKQGPVTGRGQERGTDKPPPKGKQGPVTGQGTNLPPPKEKQPVDEAAAVNEDHNCKSAHPGMNHDQWANKHR